MNGGGSLSSRFASLSHITLNSSLGVSLVALFIGAVVVLSGLVAVGSAAFGPGVGKVNPEEELGALVAQHNEQIKTWQDRLNGRSPFFKPPPPPSPIKEPPKQIVDSTPPPPPPPPGPSPTYQGPPIAFAAGDTVYFNSPTQGDSKVVRVRVGEEQAGLRVISLSLPWSVKVGHKGGEYDVPLFNRSDQSAFVKGQSQPVILQESFISAVSPPPDVLVPPPVAAAPDPAVAQAATMSGEGVQPHQRGQPARAVAQPEPDRSQRQSRTANPQRPPRGAPPEDEPPAAEEEQPIEESGVEEEPQADDEDEGVVEEEEDPEQAAQQSQEQDVPPESTPQSSEADNADTSLYGQAAGDSK